MPTEVIKSAMLASIKHGEEPEERQRRKITIQKVRQ
jgi:hypothetical protein